MSTMPATVQPDTDADLVAHDFDGAVLPPTCDCIRKVNAFLRPLNGRLGTKVAGHSATPVVFVRRIDPLAPLPPTLVPRFCPFCGDPFDGKPRRRAPAGNAFDHEAGEAGLTAIERAVFTLLRSQSRTVGASIGLVAAARGDGTEGEHAASADEPVMARTTICCAKPET